MCPGQDLDSVNGRSEEIGLRRGLPLARSIGAVYDEFWRGGPRRQSSGWTSRTLLSPRNSLRNRLSHRQRSLTLSLLKFQHRRNLILRKMSRNFMRNHGGARPLMTVSFPPRGAFGAKRIPFVRRQSEVPPLRMRDVQACLKRRNGKVGNLSLSEKHSLDQEIPDGHP